MQNANYFDPIRKSLEEQDMSANRVLAVAFAKVAFVPSAGVVSNRLYRCPNVTNIAIRPVFTPTLRAVVPDLSDIPLRQRGENEKPHQAADLFRRFDARNASKSNATAGPLSSPATKAATNASRLASFSSRSLKPARTTSLAEP